MIAKLLTEHHLEFPNLKGGCRGSSESTLVKMSNCWKSHATARIVFPLASFPLSVRSHKMVVTWLSLSPFDPYVATGKMG